MPVTVSTTPKAKAGLYPSFQEMQKDWCAMHAGSTWCEQARLIEQLQRAQGPEALASIADKATEMQSLGAVATKLNALPAAEISREIVQARHAWCAKMTAEPRPEMCIDK